MDNKKLLTLAFVYDDDRILLGRKKRGFGEGYWNGFGGKVNPGESIVEAAKREMNEEAGIVVEDIEERGVITFLFKGNPQPWEVHVFRVTKYSGEPVEMEEMEPRWFPQAEIPYEKMWEDDPHWLPHFLVGKNIEATFSFDGNTMTEKDVKTN